MKTLLEIACLVVVSLTPSLSSAQHPLAGSWELFSEKVDGKDSQNTCGCRLIMVFDPDGHLAWVMAPSDRPKAIRPVTEMSREELVTEFKGVAGGVASTLIEGNRITFTNSHLAIRSADDDDPGYTFRVEGDVLIFNQETKNGEKVEVRYRRLK